MDDADRSQAGWFDLSMRENYTLLHYNFEVVYFTNFDPLFLLKWIPARIVLNWISNSNIGADMIMTDVHPVSRLLHATAEAATVRLHRAVGA